MKRCSGFIQFCLFMFVCCCSMTHSLFAQSFNQTDELSRIFSEDSLPFSIQIKRSGFQLPFGIQSFVSAKADGKWLFLCGRINGLHGFNNDPLNFPPNKENYYVIVVDPATGKSYFRSLLEPEAGLTQEQADSLAVTSPQFYQSTPCCACPLSSKDVLYIAGGYGYQTSTQQFITWPYLTGIDIKGLMHWVTNPDSGETAAQYIRQTSNPMLAVTGGYMDQLGGHNNPTLLCLGQDFEGTYFFGTHAQRYTEQIRTFYLCDDGKHVWVEFIDPAPYRQDPNFRRRDLNVCRVFRPDHEGGMIPKLVAFAGVFTEAGGAWTVPITINADGSAKMKNPNNPRTFKQAMQQYACANIGLYSKSTGEMFNILLGGITYGYFAGGKFVVDSELPFIGQVTTIKSDKDENFTQYFMRAGYPLIRSTSSNPGNPLLFGAGAQFLTANGIDQYVEDVLKLDKLTKTTVIGYIVGGIQSTLLNTETMSDSAASPYIFEVILTPKSLSSAVDIPL